MNDLLSWRDYFPNDLTLRNTFDHGTNIASGQGLEIRDLGVPEHPLFSDESWRKKRGGRTIQIETTLESVREGRIDQFLPASPSSWRGG